MIRDLEKHIFSIKTQMLLKVYKSVQFSSVEQACLKGGRPGIDDQYRLVQKCILWPFLYTMHNSKYTWVKKAYRIKRSSNLQVIFGTQHKIIKFRVALKSSLDDSFARQYCLLNDSFARRQLRSTIACSMLASLNDSFDQRQL